MKKRELYEVGSGLVFWRADPSQIFQAATLVAL